MKKIYTLLLLAICALPVLAQMSGTYYIGAAGTKPGGGDPDYLSLKAAIDALNSNGVNGNVTMYFTSDLVEPTTCQLGVNTGGYQITFKPHSSLSNCTITFNKNANVTGTAWYGMWVIGSKDTVNGYLIGTNNITIDGSVTDGGTTRDLTIQTTGTSAVSAYPFRIAGDCNNITIKNCNITAAYTGSSSVYGIRISAKMTTSAADSVPDNITIQNNYINMPNSGAAHGIYIDGTVAQVTPATGLVIKENLIAARTRGIMLSYNAGNIDIFKNEIKINQTSTGFLSYGIWGLNITGASSVINVYNNKITQLSTAQGTTSGTYGILGISAGSNGTWNIYDNMISGFATTTVSVDPNLQSIYGISVSTVTANIYYNTISMADLAYDPTGNTRPQRYAGIIVNSGTANLKNNIVISNEDDDSSYAIYRAGGTLVLDYNNLYQASSAGYIGYYTSAQASLADWRTASSQDAHSKSVAVTFASATDLHLSGGSIGDHNLVGTPLSSPYNVDIDGDTRNATYPYMGADEKTTLIYPLAMHTVTMSSSVNNATAFGTNGVLGTDGGATFYTHWDATYLYLGWSGGRTNYSSDMFYAAIDTDPEGTNGSSAAIDNVSFLPDAPNPDFYVVYENNSSYYGVPASNGNAFEVYSASGGTWNWVSRTDGNDNVSSKVVFDDNNGEVRLRVAWSTLGVTPSASTKLGIVMWNNNSNANYMWARVPSDNPSNGSTPKQLTHGIKFTSTGDGTNPSSSGANYWLPVELTSFTATSKNGNVELVWKTATENNNAGFEVERRVGSEWSKVGFVEGAGNSSTPKEYRFSDAVTANGSIGYRLKQIDRSGHFTYSNVVEVVITQVAQSYMLNQNYPNPFNPSTTISFSVPNTEHATVKVYDVAGKEVATLFNAVAQSGETYNVQFNASGLASGMYLYVLQTQNNRVVKRMTLLK